MTGQGSNRVAALARVGVVVVLAALQLTACKRPEWADRNKSAASAPASGKAPAGPPRPAFEAWAQPMIGKRLTAVFRKTGACVGNTDGVTERYGGAAPGAQVAGWGWESAKKHRVERVLLVSDDLTIVGAGVGGAPRGDVPRVVPTIPDQMTGWLAVTNQTSGEVSAYGIVGDGDALCQLGHFAL